MPSLTNPNNLSIVTGVPPSLHGVPGNHYLDPSGEEVQLTDPAFLRAESIHAVLHAAGARVLMVTAKDKLRRLLGAGNVPSISAERAHEVGLPAFDIADVQPLVGRVHPGIYDWDLSHYAMEIGLAVHRRVGLDLLYVSLTDYVQHKQAPGGEMADCFFRRFDELLAEYVREGFLIGITADHGMNAKPRIIYLEDVLAERGLRHFALCCRSPIRTWCTTARSAHLPGSTCRQQISTARAMLLPGSTASRRCIRAKKPRSFSNTPPTASATSR